jgi:peptidoglycan/xylan/chitin deacetylase (PgdA/CDA1 family)
VLVLSGSRPSRSWRIAEGISRETPGAKIVGIVQLPLSLLGAAQQWIAQGGDPCAFSVRRSVKGTLWLRSIFSNLLHWALWCIHGCPADLNSRRTFTIENLAEKCRQIGCDFFLASRIDSPSLIQFVRDRVDLAIVVGEMSIADTRLWANPNLRVVRACQTDATDSAMTGHQVGIAIELFDQHSTPQTVASLKVPVQPYDGPLGLTLKTDLISDDLLIQTVKLLQAGFREEVSEKLALWAHQIISPYLAQLETTSQENPPAPAPFQRFRRAWKLLLDTFLLCSPILVARNWYKRWSGRYPVLILTHHLVSDRPHRMGISTERCWRQLLFLRRHYHLIGLSEAEKMLRTGEVRRPTVVITFDDGYRDNFINLRAIADEVGVTIILFVATKPVEKEQVFEHDLPHGSTRHFALTWDQILYWDGRGAQFGSHTRSHLDCGSTDRTILSEEIVGSKRDLEAQLGKDVRFFAFPFGQLENMSIEAIKIAPSVYPLCLTALDGENLPFQSQSAPLLFRKNLYPNCWELELELQSIFLFIDRCREGLRRRGSANTKTGRKSTDLSLKVCNRV